SDFCPCTSVFISDSFLYPPPRSSLHTLSLHDALPISALSFRIPLVLVRTPGPRRLCTDQGSRCNHTAELPGRVRPSKGTLATMTSPSGSGTGTSPVLTITSTRSEEHTSELQSRFDLVCRLLL